MDTVEQLNQGRKPYETPAITYEATLEVRAGTPLGIPDPLDLFGTEKK